MKYVVIGLVVFVSAIALDYADTSNTRAVASGHRYAAALWSVTMALLGSVGVYSVVQYSWWYLVPELCGLFIGSLWAMSHTKEEEGACRCRCEHCTEKRPERSARPASGT